MAINVTEELNKIQDDNTIGKKPEIYHLAKKVNITLVNSNNTFKIVKTGVAKIIPIIPKK